MIVPKQRKIPLRKCVVTQEQHPKQELLRIVKTKDDQVFVDPSGKMNGRGCYIKKQLSVVDKAQKSKRIDKHLGITIEDNIYETMRRLIRDEA